MSDSTIWYGTGRRKSATARVRLSTGSGQIFINKQEVTEYFGRPTSVMILKQPLLATELM